MASNLASGSGTGSRRSRGGGSGSGSKRDGGRGIRGGRVGTRINIVIIDYVLQEALTVNLSFLAKTSSDRDRPFRFVSFRSGPFQIVPDRFNRPSP